MMRPSGDTVFTRNAMDAAIKIGFLVVWLTWSGVIELFSLS
jgi:hypothetical protein